MPAEGTCTAQDCDCAVVMQCAWTIKISAYILSLNSGSNLPLTARPLQMKTLHQSGGTQAQACYHDWEFKNQFTLVIGSVSRLRFLSFMTQPVLPFSIHPSPCAHVSTCRPWHPHLNLLSNLLFEKHLTEDRYSAYLYSGCKVLHTVMLEDVLLLLNCSTCCNLALSIIAST